MGPVLFIGNSYTYENNLPGLVAAFARAAGHPVATEMVAAPGATLEEHWRQSLARTAVKRGGWRQVVLQEQSTRPLDEPVRMWEYGRRLGKSIRAAGAQPVLFLPWALRDRPDSQAALNHAYRGLAEAIDARIAPIGPTWQRLSVLRPDLRLYAEDGSHPAPLGTYVAAAVLCATLWDIDPDHLPVESMLTTEGERPSTMALDPKTAALIRRASKEVVASWPMEPF